MEYVSRKRQVFHALGQAGKEASMNNDDDVER